MTAAVPCAGGIVFDERGRLLLVRRLHEPGLGLWTIPGGRCLAGELPEQACVREVAEETGLQVEVVRWVGSVRRPGPRGTTYLIDDYVCTVTGGALQAGDDAAEARWCPPDQLDTLDLVPKLRATLEGWGVLS